MGDMVLEESQVDPVMQVALDSGLDVTALHNHFLGTSPMVMFMHIGGVGDEAKLATGVGKVFGQDQGDQRKRRAHADHGDRSGKDDSRSEEARLPPLARRGTQGRRLQGGLGRVTKMHGHEVGSVMGVNNLGRLRGIGRQGGGRR